MVKHHSFMSVLGEVAFFFVTCYSLLVANLLLMFQTVLVNSDYLLIVTYTVSTSLVASILLVAIFFLLRMV